VAATAQVPLLTTMRKTTIAPRAANGSSEKVPPVFPKIRNSAPNAGQAGHSHGPNQEKTVMPRPNRVQRNPRLMRSSE